MNQPMRELPQYKSHKIVHALKIHNIDYDETGQAVITPAEDGYGPFGVDAEYMSKHKPRIGGYYVIYEDGYKSWSPADAFEKGYTAINGRADIAPCGYIHWEDLAKQLASVWWEVAKVGGTLQHGDLDKAETMFSVVLEQHGGQCFHGETPMDAWNKAYAWLVSPERPAFGPSQVSVEIAARIWCDPEMSSVVMDSDAALQIATIVDRVKGSGESPSSLPWSAKCDTLLTKLQSTIYSGQKRTYEEMKSLADRLTEMGATVAAMELQQYEP